MWVCYSNALLSNTHTFAYWRCTSLSVYKMLLNSFTELMAVEWSRWIIRPISAHGIPNLFLQIKLNICRAYNDARFRDGQSISSGVNSVTVHTALNTSFQWLGESLKSTRGCIISRFNAFTWIFDSCCISKITRRNLLISCFNKCVCW